MREMKRDTKWYRWKYLYQHMLEQDKWFLSTLKSEHKEIRIVTPSQEQMASQMADIECSETPLDWESEAWHKWATYNGTPLVRKQRAQEQRSLEVTEVRVNEYHVHLDRLEKDLRQFVDKAVMASNYYLVASVKHRVVGGFATNIDGAIQGLFSLEKGRGHDILMLATKEAFKTYNGNCREVKLFCTGNKLRNFYERHGFRTNRTDKWNPELAPEHWNYVRFGRPESFHMSKKNMDTGV